MRLFIVLALSVIAGTSAASAQSFDCSKARIATEFAICDSQRLSRLDEEMASLYFGLPHYIREDIKGEQRRWLRRRNACGYDRRCIGRAYRRRIDTLSRY
jgi:uncharacterized protein